MRSCSDQNGLMLFSFEPKSGCRAGKSWRKAKPPFANGEFKCFVQTGKPRISNRQAGIFISRSQIRGRSASGGKCANEADGFERPHTGKTVIENRIAQLQEQILMLKTLIDARDGELLLRDIESDANSESEGDWPSGKP